MEADTKKVKKYLMESPPSIDIDNDLYDTWYVISGALGVGFFMMFLFSLIQAYFL